MEKHLICQTMQAYILSINSPKNLVGGPYAVVYKGKERFAIVALTYDGYNALGMRWFSDDNGFPLSRTYPTWLIIPNELINSILNGLPLETEFRYYLDRFLAQEIDGKVLKSKL